MLHHRVGAEVGGLEAASLHLLDGLVHRGLHVPQGRCHHRVGILLLRVDHVADGQHLAFLGGIAHPETLGVKNVRALVHHGKCGLLGLGWIEPAVDEGDAERHLRVDRARAIHEGVHQAVHLGDGEAAHQADLVRLGHAARDHAGEVAGLLDVVVEHGKVVACGLARRARDEGDLREILGHLARSGLHAEHLAEDELRAAVGVFAHHAFVVGIGDVFGGLVFDLAARLGGLQRQVDAADPLLLEGHGVDAGDLQLFGGQH
ncbi:hypothetical protein SDC9_159023 [bioreactor metagenome]|uniref:NAD-specific glutamate dehydrogenase n=1 Tax=bioreactor metagenome TaxID=1076179 RepID=A0A645FBH3_9ZZZZ